MTPGRTRLLRASGRLVAGDRRPGVEVLTENRLDGSMVQDLELARLEVEASAGRRVRRHTGRAGCEHPDHGQQAALERRRLPGRDDDLRIRRAEHDQADEPDEVVIADAGPVRRAARLPEARAGPVT